MKKLTFKDMVKLCKDRKAIKPLQMTLNSLGAKLIVDGIIGPATTKALNKVDKDKFMVKISETFKELIKPRTTKERVLSILSRIEGTKIHKNHGEKSVTLPYGLYIYKHPNAKPTMFYKTLLKKYKLNDNNIIDNQHKISKSDFVKLTDLTYDYYMEHMFKKDVATNLKDGELYIYMANTILSEVAGMKSLQHALGVNPDGKFGPITKYVLEFKAGKELLGNKMLDYMESYLISIGKGKRKRYLRGWMNRIKYLRTFA